MTIPTPAAPDPASDTERVKHGPHCRTHMAATMPNYGSDCTCGGNWTPQRQLEALIARELWPAAINDPYEAERAATILAESGLVIAAPGTLAALAANLHQQTTPAT